MAVAWICYIPGKYNKSDKGIGVKSGPLSLPQQGRNYALLRKRYVKYMEEGKQIRMHS